MDLKRRLGFTGFSRLCMSAGADGSFSGSGLAAGDSWILIGPPKGPYATDLVALELGKVTLAAPTLDRQPPR